MGWNRHNCTCPIFHENKIGNINGHLMIRNRIDAISTCKNPLFFQIVSGSCDFILLYNLLDKRFHSFFLCCSFRKFQCKRILRGQTHKGCTEKGVWPGSKNCNLLVSSLKWKINCCPFTFANPVFLHGNYSLRPPGEFIAIVE